MLDRLLTAVAPPLGAAWLKLVKTTMRLEYHGREGALPDDDGPVIYAFWHAQLAMMPWVQLRPPSVVPVSRSRDGEWTTRLFARLNVETVRGSSTRGGAQALRGLIRAARRGQDLAITPDGPKGPAGRAQIGAVWLARATGRPLLPVAFACRPCTHVGSWDRMIVPLPFGRGAFEYGELLWVRREGGDEIEQGAAGGPEQALEADRLELEKRLEETTKRAAQRLVT